MQDEDPSPRIPLIVADDHPLYRSALTETLRRQSDLEVVGEAADGREALELCRRLRPKLALLDIRMPEMDGISATRAIKQELPDTIVLMITAIEDQDQMLEALKAGAAGYLLKDATPEQMMDAIRKALSGEFPLNAGLASRLLRTLADEMQEGEKRADPASTRRAPEEVPRRSPRSTANRFFPGC